MYVEDIHGTIPRLDKGSDLGRDYEYQQLTGTIQTPLSRMEVKHDADPIVCSR